MKIVQRLRNLSMRQRLVTAVVLFVLLPWAMMFFLSSYLLKGMLEERAVKQSEDVLLTVSSLVRQSFDDMMYVSNMFQLDAGIVSLLKEYRQLDQNDPRFDSKNALHHLKIDQYLEASSHLLTPSYVTILLNDDLAYTSYPQYEYNPRSFYKMLLLQELMREGSSQIDWIGTHENYIASHKDSSPYVITIARALKEYQRTYGYTVISVREEFINESFRPFSKDGRQLFLVNRDGIVLSSEQEETILKPLPFKVEKKGIVTYEGRDHLLVATPFAATDWQLVTLVPYRETVGSINSITRAALFIQGVFLLLFLIGLLVLVREITKPVAVIGGVMRRVKEGDLHVRTGIRGDHDIAELSGTFDGMLDQIEDMIETIKDQEEGKRQAELDLLQAQINPHFLFNVLNAIRLHIAMNGDKESAQLIHSLSTLLRMTINRNNPFLTLKEELSVVKEYVRLMNFRHGSSVLLETDCAEESLLSEEVPRFLLQPLIENAIIHGFYERSGTIRIFVMEESPGFFTIHISDDGAGMGEAALEQLRSHVKEPSDINRASSFSGIGTSNVHERLRLIYGGQVQMEINSQLGRGTRISLHLPRKGGDDHVSGRNCR